MLQFDDRSRLTDLTRFLHSSIDIAHSCCFAKRHQLLSGGQVSGRLSLITRSGLDTVSD
jgi:hypothetical protein